MDAEALIEEPSQRSASVQEATRKREENPATLKNILTQKKGSQKAVVDQTLLHARKQSVDALVGEPTVSDKKMIERSTTSHGERRLSEDQSVVLDKLLSGKPALLSPHADHNVSAVPPILVETKTGESKVRKKLRSSVTFLDDSGDDSSKNSTDDVVKELKRDSDVAYVRSSFGKRLSEYQALVAKQSHASRGE